MAIKICKGCGIEKDVSEFHKSTVNKLGCIPYCKECKNWKHRSSESKEKILLAKEGKKRCVTCKQIKSFNDFKPRKSNKDGLMGICGDCMRKYAREYAMTEVQKKKRQKHEQNPVYLQKLSNYRRNNPKYKETDSRFRKSKKFKAYRKRADVRLKHNLRLRIWTILKDQKLKKDRKFDELIGCTGEYLQTYIESLWQEGMSWENYGKGFGKWSVDHIRPCKSFLDLSDIDQQRECFNFKNLQPLWCPQNSSKNAKYNGINYRSKNNSLSLHKIKNKTECYFSTNNN
jgi:hypothetical protein